MNLSFRRAGQARHAVTLGLLYLASALLPSPVSAAGAPFTLIRDGATAGPLRKSTVNPRYFEDATGKVVYLTGSHTWLNFIDGGITDPPRVFDFNEYLDFIVGQNHNFFRLWVWEQAKWGPFRSDEVWFTPQPYPRTGPGNALDGKPKWDLTQFNEAYFQRMRARVIAARDRGFYVSVMLFDGWSNDDKDYGGGNPWLGHPFHRDNNVNGIDGDPFNTGEGKRTHTLDDPVITALQDAYVRKVIDTVNDLDNVLYEISNESHATSELWQYHMIDLIHSYEATKPLQHPVGMTVEFQGGENDDLFASNAEWISPNAGSSDRDNPPAVNGEKIILLDTDHYWGTGGDQPWIWKCLTRGYNPIFMDPYHEPGYEFADPNWIGARRAMGQALTYAHRMNFATMTPQGGLSSTGYCLAHAVATGAEYLAYAQAGGTFTVNLAAASGSLTVEWLDPTNGVAYDGGTVAGGATRSFNAPFSGDAVLYLKSQASGGTAPTILTAPPSQSAAAGGSVTFTVSASGTDPLTYQWLLDNQPIAGATGASYTLPSAQRFHAGSYAVTVTNAFGSETSTAATFTVDAPAPSTARLLNLSTRGLSQSGANTLIPGFVVQGTASKRLLIRAIGPSLANLGFEAPVIPDPQLVLKRADFSTNPPGYVDVLANDDWGTNANAAEIAATSAQLQAFALTSDKDAALLLDLTPGQYSVVATEKTETTGIAIVELYDADAGTPAARLINISNRGYCGVGDQVMIPGFVVSAEGPKTLLVRVVGPTLAGEPYNVPGTMADPKLTVYRTDPVNGTNTEMFTQDDWSDSSDATYTAQIATQVSAFALADGSSDAAFVLTLAPGVYTVVGASADGTGTGVVLVEVYVAG